MKTAYLTAALLCAAIAGARAQQAPAPSTPSPPTAPTEPAAPVAAAPAPAGTLIGGRPVVNRQVTADDAVAIALKESPVVRGAVAEVDAAAAQVAQARAEKRPWLSTSAFLSTGTENTILTTPAPVEPRMNMAVPDTGFSDLNLMLMYPLYTGGRLEAMVRRAAATRGASAADLAAQRQDVDLLTRTAYNAVLARRALIDVWQARLKEDEERLRQDQENLKQEQIPAYYIQRDEAEVAASLQEVTNAQRDADITMVQLKTVMGVSPASDLRISGALPQPDTEALLNRLKAMAPAGAASTGASDDTTALLRLAEEKRPELSAARLRIRGAEANTSAVRGAYRPQVNLSGSADAMAMQGGGSQSGGTVGLVLSFPLYNGGMKQARIREAEAQSRRQEQERERVALQVSQDVQTSLLDLRAARQNVDTAQAALTAARAEYTAAAMRYQVGRSTIVDVLDALSARTRAESNTVQALFEYNVARDQLLRATGVLDAAAA